MPAPALIPVATAAADFIFDAGRRWIKSKFPDPAEQQKREAELAELVAHIDEKKLDSFRRFMVDYEGKAADQHPFVQILRGIVRPLLTFYLVGLLTWSIATVKPLEQIQFIFTLNLLSLGFWYGERALTRLGINSDTIKGVFGRGTQP